MLNGLKNALEFLNENWTMIVVIIGLIIGLVEKVKSFLKLSKNEKITIAYKQAQEIIHSLVADAENNWSAYKKSGAIKRSEVIEKLFERIPALTLVTNQEELIAKIDAMIDEALKKVNEIVSDENLKYLLDDEEAVEE